MYYFHFSLERQNTINNQQKAKSYPNKYLSLIIDGMDQSKTQLPHVVHAIKFTSAMWKLRVHLVGVIVHGIGAYGSFDLFDYSHSTNLTSVLLSVIYMLRESLPDVLSKKTSARGKTRTGNDLQHSLTIKIHLRFPYL